MKNFVIIFSILVFSLREACFAQAETRKVPKDFPTIQEAVNKSEPEDIVIVAPGTYYEHLQLKPGVIVRAEGSEEERRDHITARRTIIHGKKGVKKSVVEGADGAVLDGFSLTGLDRVDHHKPGHPHGIQCRGSSSIIINNVIHHMGSTGIGNHVGRDGERSAAYIANNIVYANYGLGIGCNHNSSPTIIGNIVYSNNEVGIGAKNGAHPVIEANIVFNNNFMGIGAKDGAYPGIINNTSHANGQGNVRFMGAGISSRSAFIPLISGNTIYNNKFVGLGLTSRVRTTVRGNYIHTNGISGIAIRDNATAKVEYNIVFSNPLGGIRLMGPGTSSLVNNTIYNNGMGGIIHMMGPPMMGIQPATGEKPSLIEANVIFKNRGGGVTSYGAGKKVILKNNRIYSNEALSPDPTRMFEAPSFVPPSSSRGRVL
jgi:parallel beta-helix repeat protein